jgi:hypothetical protein
LHLNLGRKMFKRNIKSLYSKLNALWWIPLHNVLWAELLGRKGWFFHCCPFYSFFLLINLLPNLNLCLFKNLILIASCTLGEICASSAGKVVCRDLILGVGEGILDLCSVFSFNSVMLSKWW